MFCQRDLNYLYDGSMEGMLSCIFEAFSRKERPRVISAEDRFEPNLFDSRSIRTTPMHAARVCAGLENKVSRRAAWVVQSLYLTAYPEKELLALDFTRQAFRFGRAVTDMMGDPIVAPAMRAVRQALSEAHQYKGLIRFSDFGGPLVAEIEPKNQVLPLIASHFCGRLRNEEFLIYDRTHRQALVWEKGRMRLLEIESLTLPPVTSQEVQIRALWRRFYKTIAITPRENPRCRQSNMPKRYWNLLTEMQQDELPAEAKATPLSLPQQHQTVQLT